MIQVEVNPETGGIYFFDKLGQRLLTDKDYGTQFTPFNDTRVPSDNVRQAFLLDKDEVIYGLGQQQTARVNERNQKLFLRNQNMISYPLHPLHQRLCPLLGQLLPYHLPRQSAGNLLRLGSRRLCRLLLHLRRQRRRKS